jgi:hypothetical protein
MAGGGRVRHDAHMAATLDLTRRALVEVAGPQSCSPTQAAVVRRYRLARLPMYVRPDLEVDRFAHLRRSYD